jgi:hypothetical protein
MLLARDWKMLSVTLFKVLIALSILPWYFFCKYIEYYVKKSTMNEWAHICLRGHSEKIKGKFSEELSF